MKLKCKTRQHLLKLYHLDFLGQQGFLLPGEQPFSPGKRVDLHISLDNEHIGTARTSMIWQNLSRKRSEALPQGTFLKLLEADEGLLRILSP
ncbi:MAG: hypothetical protein K9K64_05510 [Desulfohalobiaceae bacterium]|nr:hypothetical protein [Desulfohalobiaceae bacterium]